jgi:hypothetical protein
MALSAFFWPEKNVDRIRFSCRLPRRPNLRTISADARTQEIERTLSQHLRFFDPTNLHRLERLDALRVLIGEAPEANQAIAGSDDVVMLNEEHVSHTE